MNSQHTTCEHHRAYAIESELDRVVFCPDCNKYLDKNRDLHGKKINIAPLVEGAKIGSAASDTIIVDVDEYERLKRLLYETASLEDAILGDWEELYNDLVDEFESEN